MIERILGMDGKTYPPPLGTDDLEWLVGRVHFLHHDEDLSIRQIVRRLDAENGVRRSVGTVHAWLQRKCDRCSGELKDDT